MKNGHTNGHHANGNGTANGNGNVPMPCVALPADVLQKLQASGQEHLLSKWEELSSQGRAHLLGQLNELLPELDKLTAAFRRTLAAESVGPAAMEPLPDEICGSAITCDPNELAVYRDMGLDAISKGRVAVLLMAGGQGTRLGVTYPKGMFNVGLPSNKPLYQLQAERILRLQKLAQKKTGTTCPPLPWYIMVSTHTRGETERFFADKNFFGLEKSQIVFFEQSMIPAFSPEGKIVLAKPDGLALSPDGNGGLYSACAKWGVLDDMSKRGVDLVHAYCVDNVLVRVADPAFIGFCEKRGAECAAKWIERVDPSEPVGVICSSSGKYKVAEYSEVGAAGAARRPDNRLQYRQGNIANHFFTRAFLERVASMENSADALPYHIARKKVACVDNPAPTKPNAIKLEKFVFDVFAYTNKFAVWEVDREAEFSPLKNGESAPTDNATTCRNAIYKLHRK